MKLLVLTIALLLLTQNVATAQQTTTIYDNSNYLRKPMVTIEREPNPLPNVDEFSVYKYNNYGLREVFPSERIEIERVPDNSNHLLPGTEIEPVIGFGLPD